MQLGLVASYLTLLAHHEKWSTKCCTHCGHASFAGTNNLKIYMYQMLVSPKERWWSANNHWMPWNAGSTQAIKTPNCQGQGENVAGTTTTPCYLSRCQANLKIHTTKSNTTQRACEWQVN